MPKEITAIVYNESNYDYHSIIKKISEEFERQFTIILLKEFMQLNINTDMIIKNRTHVKKMGHT